jgi:hypothetical protein
MARSTKSPQTNELTPSASDIARRAFELYCARGYENGHDLEDWLQAERELREATASPSAPSAYTKARRSRPMPTAIGGGSDPASV